MCRNSEKVRFRHFRVRFLCYDEDNKNTDDVNTENPDDADDQADSDNEEEPAEPVTAKTLYDFFREAKLTAMQSEAFTEKFNTWKENTKIITKKNLLTAFSKNG